MTGNFRLWSCFGRFCGLLTLLRKHCRKLDVAINSDDNYSDGYDEEDGSTRENYEPVTETTSQNTNSVQDSNGYETDTDGYSDIQSDSESNY